VFCRFIGKLIKNILSFENRPFLSCDLPCHPSYLGEVPDHGGVGEGVDGVLLGPAGLLQLGQGPLHLKKIKIFISRSIKIVVMQLLSQLKEISFRAGDLTTLLRKRCFFQAINIKWRGKWFLGIVSWAP
jgi:hypothetical protein